MFLPIHAAGFYKERGPGFKISDFVTASYTPSLTVMLEKSQRSQSSLHGLLGVSQERTPGQRPLPHAEKELTNVDKFRSRLNIHRLPGELATVESVVEGMEKCSWVHLACHGTEDMAEPLHSAFLLHDGKLTLSKIITKSLPHADFTFLSACQTAIGDDNLPGEAVHLSAGMLAAGHVRLTDRQSF
jgi:CHAT domain-containing protein